MNEAQTQAYALYEYVYYWIGVKDSEWKNNPKPTSNEKCERLYSKGTIQGLREEIDNLCGSSSTLLLCQLEGIMKVADTADKLIDYANNSSAQSSLHLMEAFQIAVNAAIRKMNALYPNWMTHLTPNYYERADYASFKSTINEPSWIKTKFKDISMYLFNNLDNIYNGNTDEGFDISYMLDLLPNNYNCDDISAEFGSVCWTIGVFDGMIKTLKHNAFGTTKNVMINTAVDYKAFLEHTQTERLLQLSEMSLNNLLTIAEELRDDIVHTIEQSAAETTNQIAGGIQSGFDSLRKHFEEEASFDKAIATADIAYINAEINKYTTSSIHLMLRVAELIEDILYHAMVAALGDQVEAGVKMVAHLLEACNPISWLTGGTSAVDMMDAAADVSQTLATALALEDLNNAWSSLKFYSIHFVEALIENQDFLENIGKLVKSLSADIPPSDFQEQKDKFIKGYNDYSPGVDVEYLTGISTKWELVIDEACDLIDGTSGAVSGGAKIAMGSSCLSAKGEVQKLIALYEEIFDFQFDMMDALTECVRASNSFVSASSVSAGLTNVQEVVAKDRNSNVLEELKLLATSSSMAYRFSVLAAKENYCNLLEYREGSRPELCKTHDWNLSNLLSRIQPSYHSTQDFKTVPTRPASSGDKAFIDLKDLYAGKVVRFQIPDSDWLVEKGWISSDDRHKPIFVQRFEVYLPVISSSEKQVSLIHGIFIAS